MGVCAVLPLGGIGIRITPILQLLHLPTANLGWGNELKPAIPIAGFKHCKAQHLVPQCGSWVTIFLMANPNRVIPGGGNKPSVRAFQTQIFRLHRKICPSSVPENAVYACIFAPAGPVLPRVRNLSLS